MTNAESSAVESSVFHAAMEKIGFEESHGWFRGPCPHHNGDSDSCAYQLKPDGSVSAKCHSQDCSWADLMRAAGFSPARTTKKGKVWIAPDRKREWSYKHGSLDKVLTTVRQEYDAACSRPKCNEDGPHKHIFQAPGNEHRDGFLPRFFGFDDGSKPVVVVEGEKAAEAVSASTDGFVACTSIGGSSAILQADWSPLDGRDVILWPDMDEPGLRAMMKLTEHLWDEREPSSMRVLNGSVFEFERDSGKDAADIGNPAAIHHALSKVASAPPITQADVDRARSLDVHADDPDPRTFRTGATRPNQHEWCRHKALHAAGDDDGMILQDVLESEIEGRLALFPGDVIRVYDPPRRRWRLLRDKGAIGAWARSSRSRGGLGVCRGYCAPVVDSIVDAVRSEGAVSPPIGLVPYLDGEGELCVMHLDADKNPQHRDACKEDLLLDIDESELLVVPDDVMDRGMRGEHGISVTRRYAEEKLMWKDDTYNDWCGLLKKGYFQLGPHEVMVLRGESGSGKGTMAEAAGKMFGPMDCRVRTKEVDGNFLTSKVVDSGIVRFNEARPSPGHVDEILSWTGGEKIPCEKKFHDKYDGYFRGIVLVYSVAGIANVKMSDGLERRLRVFQTRKSDEVVSDADRDAVVADGGLGLLFDVLSAKLPDYRTDGSESSDQVRIWSRTQVIDADDLVRQVGAHVRAGEASVALSDIRKAVAAHYVAAGDDRAAKRVANRMTVAELRSACDFYGWPVDDPESQRPKIMGVALDVSGCDVCSEGGAMPGFADDRSQEDRQASQQYADDRAHNPDAGGARPVEYCADESCNKRGVNTMSDGRSLCSTHAMREAGLGL